MSNKRNTYVGYGAHPGWHFVGTDKTKNMSIPDEFVPRAFDYKHAVGFFYF